MNRNQIIYWIGIVLLMALFIWMMYLYFTYWSYCYTTIVKVTGEKIVIDDDDYTLRNYNSSKHLNKVFTIKYNKTNNQAYIVDLIDKIQLANLLLVIFLILSFVMWNKRNNAFQTKEDKTKIKKVKIDLRKSLESPDSKDKDDDDYTPSDILIEEDYEDDDDDDEEEKIDIPIKNNKTKTKTVDVEGQQKLGGFLSANPYAILAESGTTDYSKMSLDELEKEPYDFVFS